MAHNTRYTVQRRRKRELRTDYARRLELLKSRKTRLVIRKSGKSITMQLISYQPQGDRIVAQTSSPELKSLGWKVCNANLPEAYLVGMMIAKKGKAAGVEEAVLDTGLYPNIAGSRVYAALAGAVDGGLTIPHSEEVRPSEERLNGSHISSYASKLETDKDRYEKTFQRYIKAGINPKELTQLVSKVKQAIK